LPLKVAKSTIFPLISLILKEKNSMSSGLILSEPLLKNTQPIKNLLLKKFSMKNSIITANGKLNKKKNHKLMIYNVFYPNMIFFEFENEDIIITCSLELYFQALMEVFSNRQAP
jgi:hypothetical protein